jgi:hypothetical protein
VEAHEDLTGKGLDWDEVIRPKIQESGIPLNRQNCYVIAGSEGTEILFSWA